MEQQVDLGALSSQQIDPEVFRRVWNRVMPNQENSPLTVDAPGARKTAAVPAPAGDMGRSPAPPVRPVPAPEPPPRRQPAPVPPPAAPAPAPGPGNGDEQTLRALMERLWQAAVRSQELSRRAGSGGRPLSALAADCRQGLRQLSTAYFLAFGRWYQPSGRVPAPERALSLALREQFLWEGQWARDCLQAAEGTRDPALQELYRELAERGRARARSIRAQLERMEGK